MEGAALATLGQSVRLKAEMSRRPLVIALVALLAVLLLAPIVLLMVAGLASEPIADGALDREPDVAPAVIGPGDVAWTYVTPVQADGRAAGSYRLQAGRLDVDEPLLDIDVRWGADPMVDPGREPVVGQAADGTVHFVEDDGTRSVLWRTRLAPNSVPEVMAELPEIMWSIAVTADGAHAYAALVDRAAGDRDAGVVRIALDGSGATEAVLGPAAPGEAGAVRLAAWVGLDIDLRLSGDGRHLVRRSCVGGAGCESEVLDLTDGEVMSLGEREVYGIARGVVLIHDCFADGVCGYQAMDLATGRIADLPQIELETQLVDVDGRAIVAYVEPDRDGGWIVRGVDPRDGNIFDIHRPPADATSLTLIASFGLQEMTVPPGHLLVSVGTDEEVGALFRVRTFAVPVGGGEPVELPEPAIRIPGQNGING